MRWKSPGFRSGGGRSRPVSVGTSLGFLALSLLCPLSAWSSAAVCDSPCYEAGNTVIKEEKHRLTGRACYYSDSLDGRRTASGEIFRQSGMTAAHRTLPLGTVVEVTSRATGKCVQVRINDRGPFKGGFVLDLSRSAAHAIGVDTSRDRRVSIQVIETP